MKLARQTEAGLYVLSKVTAVFASIVLAAMMLVTVADVTGRYCFNSPIRGTWELVGLLLVCAGTWGWGYCQMEKGHISVPILIERFSLRALAIIRSLAYLIGFGGFSLLCWQMLLRTMRYIALKEGGVTDTLEMPYYPFMLALAIGAGVLALIILIDLLRSLTEVARK